MSLRSISFCLSAERARRGFSFTEIMFAVVILGIGFIMVAAIFPVSLQQSKSTTEEINAAGIARAAVNFSSDVFNDNVAGVSTFNLSATGSVGFTNRPLVKQIPSQALTNPAISVWDSLRAKMIFTEDPRYGYVMLYRRNGDVTSASRQDWAPYTQVFIFPIQVRNKETLTTDDTTLFTNAPYSVTEPGANLMAHRIRVSVAVDESGVSLIGIDTSSAGQERFNVDAAVEGAYVVISDDHISSPANPPLNDNRGRMNGKIYKLGARRADMDTDTTVLTNPNKIVFELAPGSELVVDPGADGVLGDPANPADPYNRDDISAVGQPCPAPSNVIAGIADAFIVGRGYANPLDPNQGFDGAAMPIAAYTTFVKVK